MGDSGEHTGIRNAATVEPVRDRQHRDVQPGSELVAGAWRVLARHPFLQTLGEPSLPQRRLAVVHKGFLPHLWCTPLPSSVAELARTDATDVLPLGWPGKAPDGAQEAPHCGLIGGAPLCRASLSTRIGVLHTPTVLLSARLAQMRPRLTIAETDVHLRINR